MAKKNKLWRCVGQNFVDGVMKGGRCCGDINTIDGWLKRLFPDKYKTAVEFFKGDTEGDIAKYIYKNLGVYLEVWKPGTI